ncbi:SDR family NAD(P)-dependent oxidoreductase, partial [Mesorhizobium sp. M7D.F.Ca.US.004.03.1.1]|uniref:SDR family NAD(P)-dependent oxidoreductase n=1 Tax=Mesorhizobium sp. M7D.F.Ca.US.004.03.1.1 TaxID=2496702 RepID=UPI0013E3A98D
IYRASKTGLNALWRTLSVDWRKDGISCVLLRPGLVRTELSEMQGMDPAVSVAGLLSVVNRLSFADTGRLISYEGGDFPW